MPLVCIFPPHPSRQPIHPHLPGVGTTFLKVIISMLAQSR